MDRNAVVQILHELEARYPIEHIALNPPMNWVTYHEKRIERESLAKSGKWDSHHALAYIRTLEKQLKEKYGDRS